MPSSDSYENVVSISSERKKRRKRKFTTEKKRLKQQRARAKGKKVQRNPNDVESRCYVSTSDLSTQLGQPRWTRYSYELENSYVLPVNPEDNPQLVWTKNRIYPRRESFQAKRKQRRSDNHNTNMWKPLFPVSFGGYVCKNWSPIYGLDTTLEEYYDYKMKERRLLYKRCGWGY